MEDLDELAGTGGNTRLSEMTADLAHQSLGDGFGSIAIGSRQKDGIAPAALPNVEAQVRQREGVPDGASHRTRDEQLRLRAVLGAKIESEEERAGIEADFSGEVRQ